MTVAIRSLSTENHALTVRGHNCSRTYGFPAVNLSMYPDYVMRWQQRYAEVRNNIAEAIDDMRQENGLVPDEIAAELSTEWFLQRAFDLYLWQAGVS